MEKNPISERFNLLERSLDERMRRIFCAAEAKVLGHGGVTAVSQATGVSRRAIHAGLKELDAQEIVSEINSGRIRQPGGGRKKVTNRDPMLMHAIESLVEPETRGDPESPLRWTTKSLRRLSDELKALGHSVSHTAVGTLLEEMGYSLQSNVKTLEGGDHPDRNAQFEYINERTKESLSKGEPVISVDTKKKELVGLYKNNGKTWRPKGNPEKVKVHDFVDAELGRASPYGVYDLANDAGWVSVGTDHDTAAFAVQTIRRWWQSVGSSTFPSATSLMITADGGGSNGSRVRLWKVELQNLADEIGLPITVCHFPPGTSKWNKIEHRLFSFISMNWRGQPLISHEVILKLIASTRTKSGLTVKAELDSGIYPKGIKVPDEEMATLNLVRHAFHGEWNYSLHPRAG